MKYVAVFFLLGLWFTAPFQWAGNPSSSIRLASPQEVGEPLVVSGTLYQSDGKTPAPGVKIYIYNTDHKGYYNEDAQGVPRISGTLTTDEKGAYRFATIRPGSYPDNRIPAHIHYVIYAPNGRQQRVDLHFAGDRKLSQAMIRKHDPADPFSSIQNLVKDKDGNWTCRLDLKLNSSDR